MSARVARVGILGWFLLCNINGEEEEEQRDFVCK